MTCWPSTWNFSRGVVGLPVAHQDLRGALGNVQRVDQIVEARLAQRSVKPEEVPTFAQRRHALSPFAMEPVEDLRHASRRGRSWQDGFCGGDHLPRSSKTKRATQLNGEHR